MRSAALALIAAIASSPAAFAQEPPAPMPPAPAAAPARPDEKPAAPAKPAKHENKVTPAAKAFFDGMAAKAYNPVALGLKELKGTMEMNMQMPGMEDMEEMEGMEGMPKMTVVFAIDFKAPKTIAVEASTENPMLMQAAEQLKQQVKQLFLYGMGTMEPDSSSEYDADVVVEKLEGKESKVLLIKVFEKNEPKGEMRMSVDANGLPAKSVVTMVDENSGMEQTMDMTFEFAKDGEAYRLVKQIITHPMLPEPMETAMTYSEAGGFKVATGIHSSGPMGMTFGFAYTDLTVNGKKVELPKVEKKGAEKKGEEKGGEKAGEKAEEKKPEAPKDEPK